MAPFRTGQHVGLAKRAPARFYERLPRLRRLRLSVAPGAYRLQAGVVQGGVEQDLCQKLEAGSWSVKEDWRFWRRSEFHNLFRAWTRLDDPLNSTRLVAAPKRFDRHPWPEEWNLQCDLERAGKGMVPAGNGLRRFIRADCACVPGGWSRAGPLPRPSRVGPNLIRTSILATMRFERRSWS